MGWLGVALLLLLFIWGFAMAWKQMHCEHDFEQGFAPQTCKKCGYETY